MATTCSSSAGGINGCAIARAAALAGLSVLLVERERLLKAAPHPIRPLAFVLPQENAVRPWWMVRLGTRCLNRRAPPAPARPPARR